MGTGSERGFILFINRLQQLIASFFLNGFFVSLLHIDSPPHLSNLKNNETNPSGSG